MSKIRKQFIMVAVLAITGLAAGCTKEAENQMPSGMERDVISTEKAAAFLNEKPDAAIRLGTEITELKDGLSAVNFEEDDWFDGFLEQGGASDDSEVVDFLMGQMQFGEAGPVFQTGGFGCSTLTARSAEGGILFGRNFDWQNCEALVVRLSASDGKEIPPHGRPVKRYASISTVNMDFIRSGYGAEFSQLPDEIRTVIALYAPLDGMNEKGLAVSVNMIQDSALINQDTGKPDLTTTTAIRLLLNKAGSVEEALTLLGQYDMHSSMGMMVHFALADKTGRSVVVEYINHEMIVTDTPVVTNFYLAEGEKQGIGTAQSHTRYEILMERLSKDKTMDMAQVRDALDSVSKDNFGEEASLPHERSTDGFESTEWSIVFDLNNGEARYYHRENYEDGYLFTVKE